MTPNAPPSVDGPTKPLLHTPGGLANAIADLPITPDTPELMVEAFSRLDRQRLELILGSIVISSVKRVDPDLAYLAAGSIVEHLSIDALLAITLHRLGIMANGLVKDRRWANRDFDSTFMDVIETFIGALREQAQHHKRDRKRGHDHGACDHCEEDD